MEDFLGMELADLVEALESWGYVCCEDPSNPMAVIVPVTNCIGVRYIIEDGRAKTMEYLG